MRVLLLSAPETDAAMRAALASTGHDLLPALPGWRPGIVATERERFMLAVDRMMEAELLVADASAPSAEVGWCASWMLARGRLVVLTCRRDARDVLSPMLAGNPSPWQRLVMWSTEDELRAGLSSALGS